MSHTSKTHSTGCRDGLIAAGIVVALLVIALYVFWPKDFLVHSGPHCLSQMKMLTMGLLTYAAKHEGRLPPTATWVRDTGPYTGNAEMTEIECAERGEAGKVRHMMGKRWSSAKLGSIPDPASAILLYDAVDGQPAFRHRPTWGNRYEQLRNALARPGLGIGYVDGHCAWSTTVTAEMIANGRDLSIASDK